MVVAPGPFTLAAAPDPSLWVLQAAGLWIVYGLLIWLALRKRSRLWLGPFALYNRFARWCVIRWESRPSRVNRGLLTTADYLARMASPKIGRRTLDDNK